MSKTKGKVIAFACDKGGVGKTTVAYNVAALLQSKGHKVLAIDTDRQHNLTQAELVFNGTGIPGEGRHSYALLEDPSIDVFDLIAKGPNFDIIAGTRKLTDADKMLDPLRANRLFSNALKKLKQEYDYIIVDTPTGSTLTTRLSMLASDIVIVPMDFEAFGLSGTYIMFEIVDEYIEDGRRSERNLWIIPSKIDTRLNVHKKIDYEIQKEPEFENHTKKELSIRRATAVGEAIADGEPMIRWDSKAAVTKDFDRLADFIVEELSK